MCAARRTILRVTSRPAAEQHLRDLARLRRVRDRIDREYAQPLDVEALARGAHMSAGHLSREFKLAYGESPYSYLMTRRSSARSRRCCDAADLLLTRKIVRRAAHDAEPRRPPGTAFHSPGEVKPQRR